MRDALWSSSIARPVAWCLSSKGKRLIRYGTVSAVSTLVGQVTLILVFGVFRFPSAIWSVVISTVVATVPSYTLNRRWVWGKSGKSEWMREILPFWAMSIACLVASIATVDLASHWGQTHHLHHATLTALVDGATLVAFGGLWIVEFAVFRFIFLAQVRIPVTALEEAFAEGQVFSLEEAV